MRYVTWPLWVGKARHAPCGPGRRRHRRQNLQTGNPTYSGVTSSPTGVMSDAPADRQVHRVELGSGYGLLVVAAIITGALTVIGTLLAQHFGRLATGRDTEETPTKQGEQLDKTLKAQSEQKGTRRWPNSASSWTERSQSSALEP